MATEFSMISIMNAALTARGWDEIVSEGDGTPEFRVMSRNWPIIVEAELEDGNYNFTRQEIALESRTAGAFGYEDAYIVPSTVLFVRHVWVTSTGNPKILIDDWSQDGTKVYVNEDDGIIIEGITAAVESLWSANFSRGVQLKMEAVLAKSLEGEAGEARDLEAQAEIHFQRARTNSSKSRSPSQAIRPGGLAAARFGRGTR